MTRTLLVVLCEKAAKRAFIVVVMCSLGWSQSDAQNETERTLKAVQPQVIVVRECYMTTAALYAANTCEGANTVVEAVLTKCAPREEELVQAYVTSLHSLGGLTKIKADDPFVKSFMDGVRDGGRKMMLGVISDKRVELGNCSPVKPAR